MLAFHSKIEIKNTYLDRVKSHRKADEIIKGKYWEDGKGCAVGCTIHGSDHSKYETELGIPSLLARLEDGIFEELPNHRAMIWPEEFLSSINVGADLSGVWSKFAVWLLTDSEHGVIKFAKNEKSKNAIQLVSDLYARESKVTIEEWCAAIAPAYEIYDIASADYAATAAAYGAADYAAYASADYAATAAAYGAADYAYAREQARVIQADKLLELLRECK